MGIKTLARFQANLAAALGRNAIPPTDSAEWINNAMWEFAYSLKMTELQADGTIVTVQGQASYVLPSDMRAFVDNGIFISSPQNRAGGILTPETRTQYLRTLRFAQGSTQGNPTSYHKYENKLWLRPTPDATIVTYSYDYWKRAPALVNSGDVSPFDEDWDDIIFRGALYRGHLAYGEHDRMINVFNLFLGAIRSRVLDEDLEEFPEGGISLIQSEFDSIRR